MKNLYFVETNGYNHVVSMDAAGSCRYLTETSDFPYLVGMAGAKKERAAMDFLAAVEDDCGHDQIFCDGVTVIAEMEKWI